MPRQAALPDRAPSPHRPSARRGSPADRDNAPGRPPPSPLFDPRGQVSGAAPPPPSSGLHQLQRAAQGSPVTDRLAGLQRRANTSPAPSPVPAPAPVVQRVGKVDNDPNWKARRQQFGQAGLANTYDEYRGAIGSSNVDRLGFNLIREAYQASGATARIFAAVRALAAETDIDQLTVFYNTHGLAAFLQFIRLTGAILQDYIRPLAVAAPTDAELAVCFTNFQNAAAGGAYVPAAYGAFKAHYTGGQYYNFDAGQLGVRTLQTDYRSFIRQNMGATIPFAQFCHDLVTGQGFSAHNTLQPVIGWSVTSNAETQREIGQINAAHPAVGAPALPALNSPFGEQTDRALQQVNLSYAAVAPIVGGDGGRMNQLLRILADQPNANIVAVLQAYLANFHFNPLQPGRSPNPTYSPLWEAAFQAALLGQAAFVPTAVLGANFNAIRTTLHAIDGSNAPALTNPVAILARTQAGNAGRLATAIANLDAFNTAVPNVNAMPGGGLPFGNRAGGLRGHFKKHVLGIGNVDHLEPPSWLAALPIAITRANFAAMTPADEADLFIGHQPWMTQTSEFRGQAPGWVAYHVANANPVLTPRLVARYRPPATSDDYANRLSVLYENAYQTHVSAAFNAPANQRYVYFDNARFFINAYNGPDFTVASYVGGVWDLSSGYRPFASGGANAKWNGPNHANRFWLF